MKQQKSHSKVLKKSLKPKTKTQRETAASSNKKIMNVSDQFIARAGMTKHLQPRKKY